MMGPIRNAVAMSPRRIAPVAVTSDWKKRADADGSNFCSAVAKLVLACSNIGRIDDEMAGSAASSCASTSAAASLDERNGFSFNDGLACAVPTRITLTCCVAGSTVSETTTVNVIEPLG